MSWPSISTRPESGRSKPEIRLNAVLFPAPFGPMIDVMTIGLEAEIADGSQRAECLVEPGDFDHAGLRLLSDTWRIRPTKPSGRNRTKTTKIRPSTNKCRSV